MLGNREVIVQRGPKHKNTGYVYTAHVKFACFKICVFIYLKSFSFRNSNA